VVVLQNIASAQGAERREVYLAQFVTELRQDAPIFAIVGAYLLFALVFGQMLGANWLNLGFYLPLFFVFWLSWLAIGGLPAAVRNNPKAPVREVLAQLPERMTPRFAAGSLLYLALALFFGSFTQIKSLLPGLADFGWDTAMADVDAWLHFGVDPWRLLHPVMGHHAVTRVLEHIYSLGWGILLLLVPMIVCISSHLAHIRIQFLACLTICWMALGSLAAGMFLSAGPVYYGLITGDELRFAELTDYLAFSAGQPQSAADVQGYLWRWFEAGQPGLGTGISAFPSIHVATATLIALLASTISRPFAIAGGVFLLVILATSVHLAWHYAIDGYASIIVVAAVWFALGALLRARAGQRETAEATQPASSL
jgi:hypothetical protein